MKTKSWFRRHYESLKDNFEFRFETLILDLTEKISIRMKQKKINRTMFSQLLNISPPAVTKILNGTSNFTLRTLLSIADALELNLKIDFEEKEIVVRLQQGEKQVHVTLATGDEEEIYEVPVPHKTYSSGKIAKSTFYGGTINTTSYALTKGTEVKFEEAA